MWSMPKTTTRTVRLDEDLDDTIQKRAKEEKVAVNFIINRTLRKFVEWDIPNQKFGAIMTPERLLNKLIERYDDESCLELGRASAREDFKPLAEYLYAKFSPQTAIHLFRLISHYGGYLDFDVVADLMDARKQILILRHHQGHKWGKYFQGLIEEVYQVLLGKAIKIECTDYVCVAQFEV